MYHYSICTIADEVIFQKQCRALETHLPHLVKDELLLPQFLPFYAERTEKRPPLEKTVLGCCFLKMPVTASPLPDC